MVTIKQSSTTSPHKRRTAKGRRAKVQDKYGRHRTFRTGDQLKAHRNRLADIAKDTLHTVLTSHDYYEDDAQYGTGAFHDLSVQIQRSREETCFYPHYSTLLAGWQTGPALLNNNNASSSETVFEFTKSTMLTAARKLWQSSPAVKDGTSRIGLLNAATPRKPGGSSLTGGDTQEEFLVRQTTVFDSLQNSKASEQFYLTHRRETDGSGLHDHAMLYSPHVIAFKDDRGRRLDPLPIDVLSSVPVNASTVRAKHNVDAAELTDGIRAVMKERMARILRLFEERGDSVLVLGAFGVGQCCNSPDMIGEIWADLLHVRGAKFGRVFDKVVFAVPGKHLAAFESAFLGRCLESELDNAGLVDAAL